MTQKSRWELYKEKNGSTPFDLLNPLTKHTTEEKAYARYETCLKCPELVHLTKQCKQCGCFMALKTKVESSKCPLGKW